MYKRQVLKRFSEINDPQAIVYNRVVSHLVAAELHADALGLSDAYAAKGWVFFTTWDDLIERAKRSHQQYREVLELRAFTEATEDQVDGRPRPNIEQPPEVEFVESGLDQEIKNTDSEFE